MFLNYILFFLPFFAAGLAIGLVFIKKVSEIGTYYFADLFGAGLGGLFALLLFGWLAPQEVPSVIAFLPVLAGMLVIPKRKWKYLFGTAVIALLLIGYTLLRPFDLTWSQYKGIRYALNLPEAEVTHRNNSPYGYLQVVSSPVLRYAPGLSLNFNGTVPVGPFLYNNGDWYGAFQPDAGKDSMFILDYTTLALPYVLSDPERVLLPYLRGETGALHTLVHAPEELIVVEPNFAALQMMQSIRGDPDLRLFDHPAVRIKPLEPRSYLAQTDGAYDLIVLPLLGAFGGSVGLDALNEEHLLTKEAFQNMWNKLSNDGMLVVSSWMDHPYRIPLRTAATLVECLEDVGISEPRNHLVAVRSWGTLTFVVKRSALTPAEVARVFSFCDSLGFDPALLPGLLPEQQQQNNRMEDTLFFTSLDRLLSPQRASFYDQYGFRIHPVNDNSPYFFQFLKWDRIPEMLNQLGDKTTAYLDLGYLIVVVTFGQVLVFALVLILLPLFRLRWRGGGRSWVLLYFAGLGMGYMLLEILFIKQFAFYLGHPIYAAAVVISTMLVCSGLGSYFSERRSYDRNSLQWITVVIVLVLVGYSLFFGSLLSSTMGWPLYVRGGVALVLIAFPAYFMGIPFPMGLKLANSFAGSNVPWAWGINGCFSVMTPPLAAILSVELGFQLVMALAAVLYGISFLSVFLIEHR